MKIPYWVAGTNPRRRIVRAVIVILGAYLLFSYVLLPVRGAGISMFPTITTGDIKFVSTVTFRWREPRRGDIVAVRMAGRHVVYLKRIVAMPGEHMRFVKGIVQVNGVPLDEPYLQNQADWRSDDVTLGPSEYFVVGDNRSMQMYEHDMGVVSRDRLVGPVIF